MACISLTAKCVVNQELLWKLGGGWAEVEDSGCEAAEMLRAELFCQSPGAQCFNFHPPQYQQKTSLLKYSEGLHVKAGCY